MIGPNGDGLGVRVFPGGCQCYYVTFCNCGVFIMVNNGGV